MRKCPKCNSEKISTEKRPDGYSTCQDCGFKNKTGIIDNKTYLNNERRQYDIGFYVYKCENRKNYWKMMINRTEEDLLSLSDDNVDSRNGDYYTIDDWLYTVSVGSINSNDGHGEMINSENRIYKRLSVFDDVDLINDERFDIVGVMWYNK